MTFKTAICNEIVGREWQIVQEEGEKEKQNTQANVSHLRGGGKETN